MYMHTIYGYMYYIHISYETSNFCTLNDSWGENKNAKRFFLYTYTIYIHIQYIGYSIMPDIRAWNQLKYEALLEIVSYIIKSHTYVHNIRKMYV